MNEKQFEVKRSVLGMVTDRQTTSYFFLLFFPFPHYTFFLTFSTHCRDVMMMTEKMLHMMRIS
jgi:hypothetical protein